MRTPIKDELCSEWSDKNLLPFDQHSAGSDHKVWWVCADGHEWVAAISSRTHGKGCPYCAGRLPVRGVTDFQTKYPTVAAQWSPKNDKEPYEVMPSSSFQAWWVCTVDPKHEWKARVYSRKNAGCPYCAGKQPFKGQTDLLTLNPSRAAEWSPRNEKNPDEVTKSSSYEPWWVCQENLEHNDWKVSVNSRETYNTGCPECSKNSSKAEEELFDWVTNLCSNTEVLSRSKTLLYPKELDIYIPEKQIAIEFNGVYWHTENKGRGRYAHYDKWKACAAKEVQLITVWEDDWLSKPEVVKNLIKNKLGYSTDEKVGARKCTLVSIGYNEASAFLEKHHIQGKSSGSSYIGLQHKNNLVAVAVFKKQKDSLELTRYATSCTVQGGFTKIMAHVPKDIKVVTFADLCVSDGSLYKNNGWVEDKFIKPDYKYVVDRQRKHKFGYRLKKFREDPKLIWEEGATEKELAKMNGLERIWDCGKIRYVYTSTN